MASTRSLEPSRTIENDRPLVFISITEVMRRTTFAAPTVWAKVASGELPQPVKLGVGNKVGWVEHEIDDTLRSWVERRAASSLGRPSPK